MKTIVCYGDSNTWGYNPKDTSRFPADVRWTGRLARALGAGYTVIEEGLSGRTIETTDEESPWLNGMPYLAPCLLTHQPFDLLVIMLGTNDTKQRYGSSPAQLASHLRDMVIAARAVELSNTPEILLVTPAPLATYEGDSDFTGESVRKIAEMRPLYEQVARELGCHFFDAWTVVSAVGCDNVHFTPENHHAFADAIYLQIKEILG